MNCLGANEVTRAPDVDISRKQVVLHLEKGRGGLRLYKNEAPVRKLVADQRLLRNPVLTHLLLFQQPVHSGGRRDPLRGREREAPEPSLKCQGPPNPFLDSFQPTPAPEKHPELPHALA